MQKQIFKENREKAMKVKYGGIASIERSKSRFVRSRRELIEQGPASSRESQLSSRHQSSIMSSQSRAILPLESNRLTNRQLSELKTLKKQQDLLTNAVYGECTVEKSKKKKRFDPLPETDSEEPEKPMNL